MSTIATSARLSEFRKFMNIKLLRKRLIEKFALIKESVSDEKEVIESCD